MKQKDLVYTKDLVYHKKYPNFVRVKAVKPLEGFNALFSFTDGTERIIDLDTYLRGPVFEPIRNDPALFRSMYVEDGTIVWPGEVDIDPDTLYFGDQPIPWMVEYEEQHKKNQARQLRERKARKAAAARRPMTKSKTRKKATPKPAARKTVLAKKK